MLGHNTRLENTITIPRHVNRDWPVRCRDRLGSVAVTGIPRPHTRRITTLITELMSHLSGQGPFDHRLIHPVQQTLNTIDRHTRRLRIGQQRVVTSYKLIASGTVEEKVLALQAEKRALLAGVFEASDAAAAKLSLADLKSLLKA